jgi:hypothetical protein
VMRNLGNPGRRPPSTFGGAYVSSPALLRPNWGEALLTCLCPLTDEAPGRRQWSRSKEYEFVYIKYTPGTQMILVNSA